MIPQPPVPEPEGLASASLLSEQDRAELLERPERRGQVALVEAEFVHGGFTLDNRRYGLAGVRARTMPWVAVDNGQLRSGKIPVLLQGEVGSNAHHVWHEAGRERLYNVVQFPPVVLPRLVAIARSGSVAPPQGQRADRRAE